MILFGIFLVSMLFVPPGIPFMVPEAEAAHVVLHPITDLSQPVPSGTVVEYDLDWTNPQPPSGWYVLTIFIDNANYNGNQEYLYQFDQDANCLAGGGYCFQAELIKEGEWNYLLRIHTDGESDGGPSSNALVGGTHRIKLSLDTTPTSTLTHYSTFTIGEADTTPPVVTVPSGDPVGQPANITRSTTSSSGTIVEFTVTASDDVGVTFLACTPESGSTFPVGGFVVSQGSISNIGVTTVTCSAADAAGNVATGTFTVTVHYTGDATPPHYLHVSTPNNVLSGSGSAVINSNPNTDPSGAILVSTTSSSGTIVEFTALAWDNIDGDISPSCNPGEGTTDGGSSLMYYQFQFPVGVTTVTCTASDAAGNTITVSFPVTVVLEEAADTTPSVVITNAPGSSTPGCEDTNSCFTPYQATIPVGGTIIWENSDTSAHTATSGTPASGPSGHWDSSLIMAGGSYSYTADTEGTFHYYCMVHPWMMGTVVVGDGTPTQTEVPDTTPATIMATAIINGTSPTGRTLNLVGVDGTVDTSWKFAPSIQISDDVKIGPSLGDWVIITASWTPTWQIPIPVDWEAGTYDIIWNQTESWLSPSGSTTVTIPALASTSTTPATIMATAIINGTSPTGRTLNLAGVDGTVDTSWKFAPSIQISDDVKIGPSLGDWVIITASWTPTWQIPIPVDWEAGTYDIIWNQTESWLSPSGSTTVVIPALPAEEAADTTPPPQNHNVVVSHGSWANTDVDDIFTPNPLTINVGDTVTWIWDSSHAHTSVRVWGSFVPGTQAGEIGDNYPPYTHTFNQVGMYQYTDWGKGWCQNLSQAFTDPTVCPNGAIYVVDPTPTGDTTPPVVTVPSNISVSTPSSSGITVTFTASASDNASGSLSTNCNPLSGSLFPIGTTTVTCTAIDSAGNLGSASFTVTTTYSATLPNVIAYYPPSSDTDLFTPDVLTINVGDTVTWLFDLSNSVNSVRVYGSFTAGECNYAVSNFCSIGHNYPPYTHTFNQVGTYQYSDWGKGWCQSYSPNTSTCPIGTIIVVESGAAAPTYETPPTIFFPFLTATTWPTTFYATNSTGYNVNFVPWATAGDADVINSSLTCSPSTGFLFTIGTTTVTCTATDVAGNEGTGTFTVTIVLEEAGTTPPTISFPFLTATTWPTTFYATNSTGYNVNFVPWAAAGDANVINSSLTCSPATGFLFPVGITTVTCTVSDAAGNEGTDSFTVSVTLEGAVETTLPTVTASAYLNGTSPTGRTLQLIADDLAICPPTFPCVPFENDEGYLDHTKYVNSVIAKFKMPDGSFFLNAPASESGSGLTQFKLQFGAWGSPQNEYFHSYFPIPEDWEAGIYYIVWRNSNSNGVNFDVVTPVTIPTHPSIDDSLPVIVALEDIFVQTVDPTGKTVSFALPSASDNVGVDTVSCNPYSGSFFPVGITPVTCTAIDAAGNIAHETFVVGVTYALTDEAAPTFMPISSQSISITNSTGATFSYQAPTVTDNIGVSVGPTCTPPSGDLFPVGQTIVTCTASDAAGNSGTVSFTISVVNTEATGDTIAPSLTAVQNISVEAIVANGAEVTFDIPTATDNEAVTFGPSCTPESGYFFPIGDTTVTCIAKDEAGNQGTSTFTVSVESRIQIPDDAPTDEIPELALSTLDSITVEGNTVSSIDAGDLGYFETSLITNSTSSVLVTVNVISADQTTLGVGFFKSVIGAGQSDIVLGFQVPKDTVSGIADVYVNVFTDWPQLGGVLITDEMNAQVEIIGIEPGEIIEQVEESPDEELAKMCGEGTHLEDGVCMIDQAVKLELQLESVNTKNGSPVLGSSNATITIIQFGEYQDESSSDWVFNTRPDLIKNYVETGKANLVFVDMPFLGNDSTLASQATYCADDQDRYWPYHFMLFNMQKGIDDGWADRDSLGSYAFNLGLDSDEFNDCMDSGKYQNRVKSNYDEGVKQGVVATPTFLVIFSDGTMEKITGAPPYSVFVNVLESEPIVEPIVEPAIVPTPATLTATAYLNGTSPTGRTLNLVGVDGTVDTSWKFEPSIMIGTDVKIGHSLGDWVHITASWTPTWQIPIPEDWEAGTYDITWEQTVSWLSPSGSTTVVIPALPAKEEPESSGLQVTVQNASGSSIPGCEEADLCFVPSKVTIDLGGTVTWENYDSAAHSTTSCIQPYSKDGICPVVGLEWNSGLLTNGSHFSHTFDTAGTYDYFCMVHPWMEGVVFVGDVDVEVEVVIAEEPNIEEVDMFALDGVGVGSIFLNGTESVRIQKEILNEDNNKMTISGWINPDFSANTLRLSAVSKANSFELFVTGVEDPKHHPGFSVFNGERWSTIFTNSAVSEKWHHVAAVVNMSNFSIFLDGQLGAQGTLDTTLGLDEQGRLVPQDSTINASEHDVIIGSLEVSTNTVPRLINHFSGTIFDLNITTDTLTSQQISDLYNKDKEVYQRKDILESQKDVNATLIENPTMSTKSPELSESECIELAKESGLYDVETEAYTLVCQFPFDVVIPINSRILWLETLSLENAPYHSIRSVDNLFSTGSMTAADMGFYNNTFTYGVTIQSNSNQIVPSGLYNNTFTYGVYEYYDDFDESLTGKIIIPKPTKSVDISVNSGLPECANNYSCFDTYAAQISVGEEVTWKNQDAQLHTVTSGTPIDGPDGLFDSGFIETHIPFYHTFDEPGTYDYFCMVHPWMQGKIIVGEI